jgi:hypothetical protein
MFTGAAGGYLRRRGKVSAVAAIDRPIHLKNERYKVR